MFFTDVVCGEESGMMSILLSKNLGFLSLIEKSLALLAPSVPFLREGSEEINIVYFSF